MTLKAAGHALGTKLVVSPDYDSPWECSYASRADGRDSNIAYMLHHGQIVRIDVDRVEEGKKGALVRAGFGIGIGSSEVELRKAYGRKAVLQPHPYGGENDHYVVINEAGSKYGMIFETLNGKVSEFRSGTHEAVQYSEGCS
jgi:hypothetical protein